MRKIMLATPSGEMVYALSAQCFAAACIAHTRAFPEDVFILANPQSCYIQNARNLVMRKAIEAECDFIVMFDSDMTFPSNTITRLIEAGKDCIGVAYHKRKPPYTMLGMPKAGNGGYSGVVEMEWIGTGITCFNVEAMKRMPYPWFECPRGYDEKGAPNDDATGEDIYFCREAPKYGISIWCDIPLSLEVTHLGVVMVNGDVSARLTAA